MLLVTEKIKYILLLLLLPLNIYAVSYYYSEDFSANIGNNDEWLTNVAYGRAAGTIAPNYQYSGTFRSEYRNNNQYRIEDTCNPGQGSRNGYWMGRYTLNTNIYNASKISPFGIELIRTRAYLDYERNSTATADLRRHCAISMWLVDDSTSIPKLQNSFYNETDNFWFYFNNSMEFFNEAGVWGVDDRRLYVGYYESSLVPLIMLTNAIRPDGTRTNIASIVNFDFRLDQNNGSAQTDDVGFRMVHNGNTIEFYANPDPDNNASEWPNEWMYIGERGVVWSNNIQFMFGHAQQANNLNSGSGNPYRMDADFDNILVRTAANSSFVDFKSQITVSESYQWITFEISNDITSLDAGINYIKINRPAFSVAEWNLADLTAGFIVSNAIGGTYTGLNAEIYNQASFPAVANFAVLTNHWTNGGGAGDNEIRLLLGAQITNNSGSPSNEHLMISMYLKITNTNFYNEDFSVYVMAEQFDSMSAKSNYSTCGWQRATGESRISLSRSEAEAYASVNPPSVQQLDESFSFTYYIKAKNNSLQKPITKVAILIPAAWEGTTIGSFDSVQLGSSESSYIKPYPSYIGSSGTTNTHIYISNLTRTNTSGRLIVIDYSDNPLTPGTLDVITFSASPFPGPPQLNANDTNADWICWVEGDSNDWDDGYQVSDGSTLAEILPDLFPSQRVVVNPSSGHPSWDLQVQYISNIAPASVTTNRKITMLYFDIKRDGDTASVEKLTGIKTKIGGSIVSNINGIGKVIVYKTDGVNYYTLPTSPYPTEIASAGIVSNIVSLTFDDSNIAQRTDSYPTRFWLILEVTNSNSSNYDKTISLKCETGTLTAAGPNGGIVDYGTPDKFFDASVNIARIDTHHLSVDIEKMSSAEPKVKQGSFNNQLFKFTIRNPQSKEIDATNYFFGLHLTNRGNAVSADMGYLKLFQDDGDNIFELTDDSVVMSGRLEGSAGANEYKLAVYPPIAITGTNDTVFFGAFDVDLNATPHNYIDLRINDASAVIFTNGMYSDFNPAVTPIASFPAPSDTPLSGRLTNAIIPFSSMDYDFYLHSISYDAMPKSFGTGGVFEVGFFKINMDTENKSQQFFTGADVTLSGSNLNEINGVAYLYKENGSTAGFQTNEDIKLGEVAVNAGTNFTVYCSEYAANQYNDITTNSYSPDTVYLAFKLTSDVDNDAYASISALRAALASFKITNLRCEGPNGGIFEGTSQLLLSGVNSKLARVDSHKIAISNLDYDATYMTSEVMSGTYGSKFLNFMVSPYDTDAVHYLSKITVNKKGGINLYDSGSKLIVPFVLAMSETNGTNYELGRAEFDADSKTIEFTQPFMISNKSASMKIAYAVSAEVNAIGERIGFTTPQSALTFFTSSQYEATNGYPHTTTYTAGATESDTNRSVTVRSYIQNSWDLKIIGGGNTAPVAVGLSNTNTFSYFDIIRDWTELADCHSHLTYVKVQFGGTYYADIKGDVLLYKEETTASNNDSSTLSFDKDTFIASVSFDNASSINTISFPRVDVSEDLNAPTRFWIALRITNHAQAIFSNKIKLYAYDLGGWRRSSSTDPWDAIAISNIDGLSPAEVTNSRLSTNIVASSSQSRVDDYHLAMFVSQLDTGEPENDTSWNPMLKLVFSNKDPDAQYFFNSLVLENIGTADYSHVTEVTLFRDNGDGVTNFETDASIMRTPMKTDGSKRFELNFPTSGIYASETVFWVAFDTGDSNSIGKTVGLRIPSESGNVGFADTYNNVYYGRASVTNSIFPTTVSTKIIQSREQKPFDFAIDDISYDAMPYSFTTNQSVFVGYFDLYQDFDTKPLYFTGVDILIGSSTTKSSVGGKAYLYRESEPNLKTKSFSPSSDTLIAEASISSGANFTIPCLLSNITIDDRRADRFYITFVLTADISTAKKDKIYFQITNLSCRSNTSMSGVVTNTYLLTNRSTEAMIDSYLIHINYISNAMTHYYPNQASFQNPYLRFSLRGDDPDGTNYFKHIDIITNSLSTTFYEGMIPVVRLATNLLILADEVKVSGEIGSSKFTEGHTRIDLGSAAFPIVGTNDYVFYIGYDIDSSDSVISKDMGLTITNSSISFIDSIDDNFTQTPFITGVTSGPSVETNISISPIGANWWDIKLLRVEIKSPTETIENIEVPLMLFDVYRDNEAIEESVSALSITNLITNSYFYGLIKVYTNSVLDNTYTNGKFIGSNFIANTNSFVKLTFNNSQIISARPDLPDRFFLTYTPIDFNVEAETSVKVLSIDAYGRNGGLVAGSNSFYEITATPILLQKNSVSVTFTSKLPQTVRQGTASVHALTLSLASDDGDRKIDLSSLTFYLNGESLGSNDIAGGRLYNDSGINTNEFDNSDTAIGGITFDALGRMKASFDTLVLSNEKKIFHLLLDIDEDATAGGKFSVSFKKEDQSGFAPFTLLGKSYPVTIRDFNPSSTSLCEIKLNVHFSEDSEVTVGPTMFSPINGEGCYLYLKDGAISEEYSAIIYDMLGYKITDEIAFVDGQAHWAGESRNGNIVPTGIYTAIIENAEGEKTRVRIVVKH